MKFRTLVRAFMPTLVLSAAVCGGQAVAQSGDYPNRPIKVVVPFPPGGGVDVITRMVGQQLAADYGQSVIVENRPGAGTLIAASAVADSPKDGYTLMAITADTLTVASSLQKNPVTIPEETLLPVTQIVRTPLFLAVRPESPIKSLEEFVETARKRPGELSYGSAGIGTSHHLAMELLTSKAQIDVRHVPYKGSSPALADLLGGHIDVMLLESPLALPQMAGNKVRVLGITTATRSDMAPDVKTLSEQGIADYAAASWMGIAVPRDTPAAIVERLQHGVRDAILSPEVSKRLRDMGLEPFVSESPEAFEAYATSERQRWTAIIKERGITLD